MIYGRMLTGIGIAAYTTSIYGIWWGILYGLFWEVWVGWHIAHFLAGASMGVI